MPIPSLTDERRKELSRHVHKQAEEGRNAVRQVRRDANERLKKLLKDHKISEDDERKGLETVQKITDEHVKLIDELQKKKDAELLGDTRGDRSAGSGLQAQAPRATRTALPPIPFDVRQVATLLITLISLTSPSRRAAATMATAPRPPRRRRSSHLSRSSAVRAMVSVSKTRRNRIGTRRDVRRRHVGRQQRVVYDHRSAWPWRQGLRVCSWRRQKAAALTPGVLQERQADSGQSARPSRS